MNIVVMNDEEKNTQGEHTNARLVAVMLYFFFINKIQPTTLLQTSEGYKASCKRILTGM